MTWQLNMPVVLEEAALLAEGAALADAGLLDWDSNAAPTFGPALSWWIRWNWDNYVWDMTVEHVADCGDRARKYAEGDEWVRDALDVLRTGHGIAIQTYAPNGVLYTTRELFQTTDGCFHEFAGVSGEVSEVSRGQLVAHVLSQR